MSEKGEKVSSDLPKTVARIEVIAKRDRDTIGAEERESFKSVSAAVKKDPVAKAWLEEYGGDLWPRCNRKR